MWAGMCLSLLKTEAVDFPAVRLLAERPSALPRRSPGAQKEAERQLLSWGAGAKI